jgi:hypothetical protein
MLNPTGTIFREQYIENRPRKRRGCGKSAMKSGRFFAENEGGIRLVGFLK